jgi:hypothetical protein
LLEIQKHLRDQYTYNPQGWEAALDATYGVSMKRHEKYPNLCLFKYDQIRSPLHIAMVRECRGIILDEANDWEIVAQGYTKFFNAGEPNAANIDWETAKVQEKVDGSLCVVYPYNGHWNVATTGTPDASGNVNGEGILFRDYFWNTYFDSPVHLPDPDCGACFMFELTGPLNRIVVQHDKPSLTLLGARRLNFPDCPEISATDADYVFELDANLVKEYPLKTMQDVLASLETMRPLQQEGYVIVDKWFRRIKVKHPGYVALHHMKEGLSDRSFVDTVRKGEELELAASFPEFAPRLLQARERYDTLLGALEREYEPIRGIAGQKDFALANIAKSRWPAPHFAVRAGKVKDHRDFLGRVSLDTILEQMGY